MTAAAPVRRSAMHRAQRALGARFRTADAWEVADAYGSIDDEVAGARRAVGLVDTSAGGKLGLRGDDVESVIAKLAGSRTPAPGAATRARLDGAAALVCRLASDEVLVLTGAAEQAAVGTLLARAADSAACAHATDLTSALASIDLVGPRALDLLTKLVAVDLARAADAPLAVVQAEIMRIHAILIRLDHPHLTAFRILVPREYGDFTWHTLFDAGRDLSVLAVGAAAHARLVGEP